MIGLFKYSFNWFFAVGYSSENGFVLLIKKSISLIPRKEKTFSVTAPVCKKEGRFTFLGKSDYEEKAAIF